MIQFEWDDAKARANERKHGVTFERATLAFADPFAVVGVDDREDYGEERFVLLGMAEGPLFLSPTLSVATVCASSQPDGQQNMSKKPMTERSAEPPFRPMTDDEVLAAALDDPDARPLTPADLKRMKRVPRVKIIRRALGLTQEEFAARYRIPLGTLRDWEQGRSEPDAPAKAYLRVIAAEPTATAQVHVKSVG